MTNKQTIERAIRHFECMKNDAIVVLDSGFGTHPGESDLFYKNRKMYAELAIAALEKQIPKKGIKQEIAEGSTKGLHVYICPICKGKGKCGKYCSECGQKIDWRDGEYDRE